MVAKANALSVPDLFEARTVNGIYINFPDPWDKRRWQKHRILTPGFVRAIHSILKKDGYIAYKTDHLACYRETLQILRESRLFKIARETEDLYQSSWRAENIPTEFESMFISEGFKINYLLAKKI